MQICPTATITVHHLSNSVGVTLAISVCPHMVEQICVPHFIQSSGKEHDMV